MVLISRLLVQYVLRRNGVEEGADVVFKVACMVRVVLMIVDRNMTVLNKRCRKHLFFFKSIKFPYLVLSSIYCSTYRL